jgi:uncharacterized protein
MAFISSRTSIPVIDTHIHVFPDKLGLAVRRWFEAFAWPFHLPPDTARGYLDNYLSGGLKGMVLMSYAHRPGVARDLNAFVGDLLRRYPCARGLAAVHPDDPRPKDIIAEAFEKYGLSGVKLHCHVQRTAPDDPRLFPVYEALLEWDGVLNIHAGTEPASDAYGVDLRTVTGASRVANVLTRYPDMKMIVPHFGWNEFDRFAGLVKRYPHVYMDTTMMLAGFFPAKISPTMVEACPERMLYGTDYPHIPYAVETELDGLLSLDLKPETLRLVLSGNASRLYGFSVPGPP